jgi:two-component system chemotaxis response regulator CheY
MRRGKLLHVEDDPAFRQFVADALALVGSRVDTCETAIDALTRLRTDPEGYVLVILDLVLPHMNGLEFLTLLRADPDTAGLPVLITSGTFVHELQFARDGHVGILRKPFDHTQIVLAVESLLYTAARRAS